MRLSNQARSHRLRQLLPEDNDGLGQHFQCRLGFLHIRRQRIELLIEAVVQTLPNLDVPLLVPKLLERTTRRRGHDPILLMSKVCGIFSPLTLNLWSRSLRPKKQGMPPYLYGQHDLLPALPVSPRV
jgi:hypothetical protein